jgi:hypothetical protein
MKTAGQFINLLKCGNSDKKLLQIQKITKKNHFNSDTHSLTDFLIYISLLPTFHSLSQDTIITNLHTFLTLSYSFLSVAG